MTKPKGTVDYEKDIEEMVKEDHGGTVPVRLRLPMKRFAKVLQMTDLYDDQVIKDGVKILEQGSMGNLVSKQHPDAGLAYQHEMLCLAYFKALGATAAKAAAKPEDPATNKASSSLDEFIDGING